MILNFFGLFVCFSRLPAVCSRPLPGHSGGSGEREVRLQVSAGVPTAAAEESAGAEAGGGNGHDPQ